MKRVAVAAILSLAAILLVAAVAFAGRGAPTAPPGRVTVPAPIDQIQVLIRESNPPQVTLSITAGLPSGCAQRHSYSVSRSGDTFTVSVLNSMPAGAPACTMIYGTYDLSIDLGRDFALGATYTVRVNDETTTFKT